MRQTYMVIDGKRYEQGTVFIVKWHDGIALTERRTIFCDYDSDTKSSLKELKELGADGIICSSDKLSKSLVKKAKEHDLRLWVRCENKVYDTIKAMYYCVDGIVSTEPDVACMIRDSWGENIIDDVKGVKESYNIK